MLFNSVEFFAFFALFFFLYACVLRRSLRWQNLLILTASYVFYGWWDWRFLSLIALSTVVDFVAGLRVHSAHSLLVKRVWLGLSIAFNIGMLGFFKYYNFFVESFVDLIGPEGSSADYWTLNIVLPVGISFYTFQTMSYTLDIYNGRFKPVANFIDFAAFVSFFPQLVAGPIERASNLLPQIINERQLTRAQFVEGAQLVVYGLFKKIVIADSLAPVVNEIFGNYASCTGGELLLGAIFFSFQIYGDFSGYSDIARGIAKMMGIDLMVNFRMPYFSRDIGEFWRRWHISLSTWFRDYVYIPLGGSKCGKLKGIRNVFVTFLISGFWHGANWTFIVWGLAHALLFVPSFISGKHRTHTGPVLESGKRFPRPLAIAQMLLTFILVSLLWVFFRSESVGQAIDFIASINLEFGRYTSVVLVVFLAIAADIGYSLKSDSAAFYSLLTGAVCAAAFSTQQAEFIYFQF